MLASKYIPPVAIAMSLCGRYAVRTTNVAAPAMPVPKPLGKMAREARGELCPCQVKIKMAYAEQALKVAR
jgi:hypothetical protein